jgi:hypothetical protein
VDFKHEQFDHYGEYQHRTVATHSLATEEEFFDALEYFEVADIVDDIIDTYILTMFTPVKPNFEWLRPFFGWTPSDTINSTFEVTTQYVM